MAHNSPFQGKVKVGTIDAYSSEQAILIAAERDGWVTESANENAIGAFLDSIEDQYVAVPVDHVRSYPESK